MREFILSVLQENARYCTDDFTPIEGFELNPNARYFVNEHGFVSLHKLSEVMYAVHVAMKRKSPPADDFFKSSIQTVFNTTRCECVIAMVCADFKHAIRLAKRCGFVEVGVIPRSLMRDGLKDQILLRLNKWNS